MLGRFTRIAVETVLAFYAARAAGEEGGLGAKSGAVTAVQRTHLHLIAVDGTWREDGGEPA